MHMPKQILDAQITDRGSKRSVIVPQHAEPIIIPAAIAHPLTVSHNVLNFKMPVTYTDHVDTIATEPMLLSSVLKHIIRNAESNSVIRTMAILCKRLFRYTIKMILKLKKSDEAYLMFDLTMS